MSTQEERYRLVWPSASTPPVLDDAQRAVADHAAAPGAGPLLVLAGPGTGKTTTLVEAVAARVEAGTAPERVLVLTFSRKAAQELRARLGARLGVATVEPLAWTFHAFAMRVLGEASALDPEVVLPPILLPGPEQDVVLRELVDGAVLDGRSPWPRDLAPALGTRGFADELRGLLARASALGLNPQALARVAEGVDRGDWRAAARFYAEYLDVTEARGVVDYAELVSRAVQFAEGPDGAALRARFDLVVVDEYQDTDPRQEALLRALAGDGRDLVVVGDPDQSIYAFRGAEVRGILEFPERFRSRGGDPAPVLSLQVCRRSGATLLAASRAVGAPLPVVGVSGRGLRRDHRALTPGSDDPAAAGVVEAFTFPHESAEAAAVADLLRREHLEGGTPWDRMAVLVRSSARSGPRLRRALASAGVPVEIATDELPLVRQPAVEPLLSAMLVAVDLAREEPQGTLTTERAHDLLVSALGGMDAVALRRLGRALRAEDTVDEAGDPVAPRSSAELVRDALLDPRLLIGVPEHLSSSASRLAALLRAAADLVAADAGAYDVLWSLWSGTSWPARLERTARAGGAEGRRADQEIDAVLALFDTAARHDALPLRSGVANFAEGLTEQEVPGDTLAERAARPSGVRLLTAHRSKGLEWDVVAVAGVQDDLWPDTRRRGSLLETERLAADGVAPPLSFAAMIAEERRLFYVAVTRAKRRLVVTAVDSSLEDGLRPSRFLDDLGVPVVHVDRAPRRPLLLTALVAEMRRVAADPATSPALRAAAVRRLARLADARVGERPLVPSADPARWWGVAPATHADVPFVADGEAVRLSGSAVSTLVSCPARWLLARQVHAEGARGPAMSMGSVVHALVDAVTTGALPADLDALTATLDAVWGRVVFDAPWQSAIERGTVVDALARFLRWDAAHADQGRKPVATEVPFEVSLDADGIPVVLRGRLDRLDLDADGRVVVVDYKTGRSSPSKAQVAIDPQLGAYQRAVEAGVFDDLFGGPDARPELGGAELVQLRQANADGSAKINHQPPLRASAQGRAELSPDGDDSAWFDHVLGIAAKRIVTESLPAQPTTMCEVCVFATSCPSQESGRQVIR